MYTHTLYISLQPPNSQGVTLIVLWLTELAALEGRDLTLGQGSHHRSTGFGVPAETGHHPNAGQVTWQTVADAQTLCFLSNVLSSHLAHLSRFLKMHRCNMMQHDATYSEIFWIAARKKTSLDFSWMLLPAAVARCVYRGGIWATTTPLAVLAEWFPKILCRCLNVSSADGLRWPHFLTFPGWWPRFSVFQQYASIFVHLGRVGW